MNAHRKRLVQAWIHYRQGHRPQSEAFCRQVLAANPGNAEAHRLMGLLLCDRERHDEALRHLQRAASLDPADAEVIDATARCLLQAKRPAEALALVRRAVAQWPDRASSRFWLGRALRESGRPQSALTELRAAHDRGFAGDDWHEQMGLAFAETGYPNSAIRHLETVLAPQGRPESNEILARLIASYRSVGRLEDAAALYERILARDPGDLAALADRADLLESLKRHDEAKDLIEPPARARSLHPALAETYARVARADKRQPDALAHLAQVFDANPTLPNAVAARLRFLEGQLHEDLGRYDEAFAAYTAGNRLTGLRFDPAAFERQVSRIIQSFTAETIERLRVHGSESERPVLVVGMPRSGTSLAEEIMAAHPEVFGAGELPRLLRLAEALPRHAGRQAPDALAPAPPRPADFPEGINDLDATRIARLASNYLDYLDEFAGPTPRRVVDKLPVNFLHLGLFAILFPKGRIVHCTRHPLDTCMSCFSTMLIEPFAWGGSLEHLAVAYGQYRRLMDHWRSVVGSQLMDLSYEAMVADQEALSRQLIAFIGLEWNDACLRFFESRRGVRTPSRDQVRKPIYATSIARWRRFEKHLGPLVEGLKGLVPSEENRPVPGPRYPPRGR